MERVCIVYQADHGAYEVTGTVLEDGEVVDVTIDGTNAEDVLDRHSFGEVCDKLADASTWPERTIGYDGLPAGQTGVYPDWGR